MKFDRGAWAAVAFMTLIGLLNECTAQGYPENIRHGYPSCTSCHIAASGGGPLTPYGRGTSEALATFGKEGEGKFMYGAAPIPDWIYLGGDQRGVGVVATGREPLAVPMQADVEVGVKPPSLTGITLDASIGAYGPEHSVEYRRAYMKADLSPTLSLRGGRFAPAYGVNLPDHTTLPREALGLGEGTESYNAEVAWVTSGGEAIVDFIYGDHTTSQARADGTVHTIPDNEMSGASWRGAAYVGRSAQVGASYLGVSNFEAWRQAYGTFAQIGLGPDVYVLAEYDRKFENGTTNSLRLVKIGYEFYQGLVVTAQSDSAGTVRERRIGLQWWPKPHWEFLLEGRRSYEDLSNKHYVDSGVLLLHHYL